MRLRWHKIVSAVRLELFQLCFLPYAFDLLVKGQVLRREPSEVRKRRLAQAGRRRGLPRPGRRAARRHHEPSAGSLRLMTGTSLGEHVMNNFSLLAANRLTHLKVMLAFACVTLVVGFGLVHSALAQGPTSISTIVARVTGTIIRAL